MGDPPADAAEHAMEKLNAMLGGPLPLTDLLAVLSETVRRHGAQLLDDGQSPPSSIVAELTDDSTVRPSPTVDERAVALLARELRKVSATYRERWNRKPRAVELLYALSFVLRGSDYYREGEALELGRLAAG